MATFSRFHKIALLSLGARGKLAYHHLNGGRSDKRIEVHNSWTRGYAGCGCNHTPSVEWDWDWDGRDPESLVKTLQSSGADEENRCNEVLEMKKGIPKRHVILIRHGEYNSNQEPTLTDLGQRQAVLTGQRLKQLGIKWNTIVRSTMTRAQETAEIIQKHLPKCKNVQDCQLIEEGAPIPPEPLGDHWKPAATDSSRIEAAFRKYFYRAPPEQTKDSYELLICHSNVIRFFVCRALQYPPEGWLRISLKHGSITWLYIYPSGHVYLRSLGATGHMDPAFLTS